MTNKKPLCALDDPLYRLQCQGLIDMTAAIDGKPSRAAKFSTDPKGKSYSFAERRILAMGFVRRLAYKISRELSGKARRSREIEKAYRQECEDELERLRCQTRKK